MADEEPKKYQNASLLVGTTQGVDKQGERRNLRIEARGDNAGLQTQVIDENGIIALTISDIYAIQNKILKELKILNLHHSKITDECIEYKDL